MGKVVLLRKRCWLPAAFVCCLAACGATPIRALLADGGPATPQLAPLATPSEGACPTLTAGSNTFRSGGRDRAVLLFVPAQPRDAPVVFLWHGLGDSAANFARAFRAREASESRGAVVAVPSPVVNVAPGAPPSWGFLTDSDVDLALFDDLRTCLSTQLGTNRERVYTLGFSAGAFWSAYLLMHRSTSIAAAAVFSGGATADGQFSPRYVTPEHDVPAILSHGGRTDVFGGFLRFQPIMEHLQSHLRTDGHFVVMCADDRGHRPPIGASEWGYEFLLAHRFGAASPYRGANERPAAYPELCAFPDVRGR
jgi:predicted esterase